MVHKQNMYASYNTNTNCLFYMICSTLMNRTRKCWFLLFLSLTINQCLRCLTDIQNKCTDKSSRIICTKVYIKQDHVMGYQRKALLCKSFKYIPPRIRTIPYVLGWAVLF